MYGVCIDLAQLGQNWSDFNAIINKDSNMFDERVRLERLKKFIYSNLCLIFILHVFNFLYLYL